MNWEDAVKKLKNDPEKQDVVRDNYFDDPVLHAAQRFFESIEWTATSALLPQIKGRALDIGAGRGITSFALAKSGYAVDAAEPDPSDIVGAGAIRELARESGLPITVIEATGEKLPFETGIFDLVYCRQVLHHSVDLGDFCKEISRVMKGGATFIAVREHVISKPKDLEIFLRNHPLHRFYGGENAFLEKDYLKCFTNAGLKVEKILNSFSSDINLFPRTQKDLRDRIAQKLKLPVSEFVPKIAFTILGRLDKTPGRLYSFVCKKP